MKERIPRVEPRASRQKRCSTCREVWPIGCFQRDRKNPDGRRNHCRACRKERREALKNGAERRRPWETGESLREAAEAAGLKRSTVWARIYVRGWSEKDALSLRTGERTRWKKRR